MDEQIIVNKTEKANSFEYGKPSERHKIYYDTPEDLQNHIDKLKKLGFIKDEPKE